MKTNAKILLIAISLLIGQSCGRTLYSPNTLHAPLIKEKNEFRASIGPNDIQSAYGITDDIGVMINGHLNTTEDKSGYGEDDSRKTKFVEAGLGHFQPIGDNGVFEIYGGAGIGKLHFDNKDRQGFDEFSTMFSRFFIQPSFGLTHRNFDVAFTLRFANLNFYNSDSSKYTKGKYDKDLRTIHEYPYFFIEPGITMRVGWKNVKFQLQSQFVRQLGGPQIQHCVVPLSFSVHVNFANRHKG